MSVADREVARRAEGGTIMTLLLRLRFAHVLARVAAAALVVAPLAVLGSATPASADAPSVTVNFSGGGNVIAGNDATYSIGATTGGDDDGFNLALIMDVPAGVAFVSSSLGAPVIYSNADFPSIPVGTFRWVWEDVSDLPVGGTYGGTVTVRPTQPVPADNTGTVETSATNVFPVGSSFTINGYAALSGDPTYLPVFDGSTGVGTPPAIAETTVDGPDPAVTSMISLDLNKSEPSPEAELLRGVHDQTTVYTMTITNTTEGDTANVVLYDFIPAALEFLGCGAVDNSTVDRDLTDAAVNEYDTAASLTGTPFIAADCPTPVSVTTVVASAGDATTYGVTAGSVYTRVVWDLGTIAAGSTTVIHYAAGIPLYENTTTFDGASTPSGPSLGQAANLDNNNGPSTRHGDLATPVDGDTWTNVANVFGDYQGIVRTLTSRTTSDRDAETIYAMDLSILKDRDGADAQFEVGNIADFTLTLRESEYMYSSNVIVTDVLPNGLCPLRQIGTAFTNDTGLPFPVECDAVGTVTGAEMQSVTANLDGTFTIVFRPTSVAYPVPGTLVLGPNETHDITYEALNRSAYKDATSQYGPTTSGDSFGNTVEFTAVTDAIAPILGWFPETLQLWDDSGASIASDYTTIDKTVMPRSQVEVGATGDPCTRGTFSDTLETGFRMGDTVCFELEVTFPTSIDVRNPVITDFLPRGMTYAGHEVIAGSVGPIIPTTLDASAGRLEWKVGTPGARGDLYVSRGSTFRAHLWATIDGPSSGPILDKPENLMKYRQQNVEGELYFLRDQAEIEIHPEMDLIKGVEYVLSNGSVVPTHPGDYARAALSETHPDGLVFASNRDGILVREGEQVRYRVDLTTMPYGATNATVWDVLPAGVKAADVSGITDGGYAADPGGVDDGYPGEASYPGATMDPTLNTRSVVVWTGVVVPYDAVAMMARKTLNYTVTVPEGAAVATTHVNDASIISYGASINTSALPGSQLYYPADSYNIALGPTGSNVWNTPGTFTRDDSSVYLPLATIAKAATSPTDNNNSADQVVKGEIAEFIYTATIPAYTSVRNGLLTDAFAAPGEWAVDTAFTRVFFPGGSTSAGYGGTFPVGGTPGFDIDNTTGALTFPALYTNATGSDQTFIVHLFAHIEGNSALTHDTAQADTATFSSTTQGAITASSGVTVITPDPQINKSASTTTVTAGEIVTYTLQALNNTGGRPTAFDTVVTDCVPAGLTFGALTAGYVGSVDTTTPIAGCAGQPITWTIGSMQDPTDTSLEYTATVSPLAAGNASYLNTADLTGYSLDDAAADRATQTAASSVTIGILGAGIDKLVNGAVTDTATIGEDSVYTITATIPALVNFWDAAIIDVVSTDLAMPADTDFTNVTLSCVNADTTACAVPPGWGTQLPTSTTTHGWWLGDITSSAQARTLTLTYTGTVRNIGANVAGRTITNTADLRWNLVNTLGAPPANAIYTPGQTTGTDTTTITIIEPAPTIVKTVAPAAPTAVTGGATVTYTLTASNPAGRPSSFDTQIIDCVPAELTAVTAVTWSGSEPVVTIGGGGCSGTQIVWDAGTIAGGTSKVATYTATVSSASVGKATYTNTAHLTGYSVDDPAADRRSYTASDDATIAIAGAGIDKLVGGASTDTATIGEGSVYTITATIPALVNFWDAAIIDVVSTDLAMPADTDFTNVTLTCVNADTTACAVPPGWGTQLPTSTTTHGWWLGDITSSAQARTLTLTYTGTVRNIGANVAERTITNTADLRWNLVNTLGAPPANAIYTPGQTTGTDTTTITVVEPLPTIAKTVDDGTVYSGQVVTYTLTAGNTAGRPTSFDSQVIDCVPPELGSVTLGTPTQGSASIIADGSCAGTRIVWDAGSLLAGTTRTLTFTATVSPLSAGGATYTNPASITGWSLDDPSTDRRSYTPLAVSVNVVVNSATATKTVNVTNATIGQQRTYTVTASIPASVNFYDSAIIDVFPAANMAISGAAFTCAYAGGGGDCMASLPPGAGAALATSGNNHGWWLGDVTANPLARTITLTFTGTVLDVPGNTTGFMITNTASFRWRLTDVLAGPPGNAAYTPGRAATAPNRTVTVRQPSVTIVKKVNTLDADTVAPGEVFHYAVTVTNSNATNTSIAYDVTVHDVVPTNVVVDAATISGGGTISDRSGNPSGGGGTITWTLASLAVGGSNPFTYDASLAPSDYLNASSLTNNATATSWASHPLATTPGFTDGVRRSYPVAPATAPTADAVVTPEFPLPVITKTPSAGPAYIGESKTFTIVVTNNGTSNALNGQVVDTLPGNWVYDTGSTTVNGIAAANPAIAGQNLTWSALPTLAPTASFTLVYTARPDASATWTGANTGEAVDHRNDATVTVYDASGSPENLLGMYTASTFAIVHIDKADLSIDKAHTLGLHPTAGSAFAWTLTVTNSASSDPAVGPIVVVDTLPAAAVYTGFTATDVGWSDLFVPGDPSALPPVLDTVIFTHAGPVATNGALPIITVNVTLAADVLNATDFTNVATVSAKTFDPDTSNNDDTDPAATVIVADVELIKTSVGGPFTAGETITWELSAINHGPSVAVAPFTVTDELPSNVDWDSVVATGTGWTCDPITFSGDLVCHWSTATLGVGGSTTTLTVSGTILANAVTTVDNTATVVHTTPDPDLDNNTDDTSDPVLISADVELVKTSVGAPFTAGETIAWDIDLTNHGPSVAVAPFTVTDTLPASVDWTSVGTSGTGWTCDPVTVGGDLVCRWSTTPLVVGASAPTLSVTATILPATLGNVSNTATVTHPTPDPDLDNNTDNTINAIGTSADLALTKTSTGGPFTAGDTITWDVDVTNNGPSDSAVPIVVTDTLPATVDWTSVSTGGTGWTCDPVTLAGDLVCSWSDSTIAAGGSAPTLTVSATILPDVTGTVYNTATVTGPTPDPDTDNNTDDATDPVLISADVELVKTSVGGPFTAGETITWNLTATNLGPSVAVAPFVLTDTLPATIDWTSVATSGTGWSCDAVTLAGVLACTWSTATLGVGDPTDTLVVSATVLPTTVGDIDNTATVTHPTPDPDLDNNTDDTSDTVDTNADLSLSKSTVSVDIPANGTGRFRIEVANAGPSDALNVIVSDTLPGGLTFDETLANLTSASGDTWDCIPSGGDPELPLCTLTSNGGTLPLGGSSWFEFDVQADATVTAAVRNIATVGSDTPDLDLDNNTDDSTTAPLLTVNKTANSPVIRRGSQVTYTINVESLSYGATDEVTLIDPIPSALRVDSISLELSTDPTVPDWTDPCVLTGEDLDGYGGTVTCVLDGALERGRTTPNIILVATVRPSTTPGTIANVAEVQWTDPDDLAAGVFSENDDALISVTLSDFELAASGAIGLPQKLAATLIALTLGLGMVVIARRRRGEDERA